MRKLATSTLFAVAAAAVAIVISAPPALAASWVVSGSTATGDITADALDVTVLTVHHGDDDVVLECQVSSADANVPNANPATPVPIGHITRLDFTTCVLGGIFDFVVNTDADDVAWDLNALSYDSAAHVTSGSISGIGATISGPLCSARIGGDAAGSSNGAVDVTYDNDTAVLGVPGTGSTLTISGVMGCGGLIANGDTAEFVGDYQVNPATLQITLVP